MKKKRILSTILGLTTLLGAFIGLTINANSDIKEVDAAGGKVTIYLDCKNKVYHESGGGDFYWYQDGAILKAHYQGGSNDDTKPMTKIMNGLYSVEIPNNTLYLDFYRCDPATGTIWNKATSSSPLSLIDVSTDYTTDNVFLLQKYDCFIGNNAGHWNGLADFPEDDGYYIHGNDTFVSSIGKSGTSWRYDTSEKMETLFGEEDKARIYNLYLAEGSSLKIKSLLNYEERWYDPYISEGHNWIITK